MAFAGLTEQWEGVEQVLHAHETVCPGGERRGQIVVPFEAEGEDEPPPAPPVG